MALDDQIENGGLSQDGSHTPAATSADYTLRLLSVIAGATRGATAVELSSHLVLSKVAVERICSGLVAQGYLARDLGQGHYVRGPALRRLALNALNRREIRAKRQSVLVKLVAEVGESGNFTTLDGASVLYLDRVEAPWPWRLTLETGAKVPLHCTASGKLFLALMPQGRREKLMEQTSMDALTPATIVSRDALRRECAAIAECGYALDREEFVPGLVAIAVPVMDAEGKVWGGISVHGPVARMTTTDAVAKLPALHRAARLMADLL